jgi:hypothetical protein
MKAKALVALVALGSAWAIPSSATTFTGTFLVDYNTTNPGLIIDVNPSSGPLSFSLDNTGDSTPWMPLFEVTTNDHSGLDNLIPQPIAASFDFISPDADGLVGGITGSFFIFNYLLWDGPETLLFNYGGALGVYLSDAIFGYGSHRGGVVSAKFTLLSAPSAPLSVLNGPSPSAPLAAPLPPAALLLGTALLGMGIVSRRKRAGKSGVSAFRAA